MEAAAVGEPAAAVGLEGCASAAGAFEFERDAVTGSNSIHWPLSSRRYCRILYVWTIKELSSHINS